MNIRITMSIAAAAFTSACASAPGVVSNEFPPTVVWGQAHAPQQVADVRLKDGGEFPPPVIAGVTKFGPATAAERVAAVSAESRGK